MSTDDDDEDEDEGLARISQMLNVRRVEELHDDDLIGEICDGDEELVDNGEELILLGERIRLVNEPNLVKAIWGVDDDGGVVDKDGDGDGFGFNLSSLPVEGTVDSKLSSLITTTIKNDSDLQSISKRDIKKIILAYYSIDYQISSRSLTRFYRNEYLLVEFGFILHDHALSMIAVNDCECMDFFSLILSFPSCKYDTYIYKESE